VPHKRGRCLRRAQSHLCQVHHSHQRVPPATQPYAVGAQKGIWNAIAKVQEPQEPRRGCVTGPDAAAQSLWVCRSSRRLTPKQLTIHIDAATQSSLCKQRASGAAQVHTGLHQVQPVRLESWKRACDIESPRATRTQPAAADCAAENAPPHPSAQL